MSRTLGGFLLLIAGLLGLFMTLCGGYFSLWGFGSGGQGMLVMSIPSLLAGVWLLSFVRRRLFTPVSGSAGGESTGGGSTGVGGAGVGSTGVGGTGVGGTGVGSTGVGGTGAGTTDGNDPTTPP
jgi:hypothetical protein